MSKELYLQLMAAFDKMKAEREDKGFVEWWSSQRLINGYLRGEALITAEHFASRAWGERQQYINTLKARLEQTGDYGPYRDETIRLLEHMIDERDRKIAELEGL